MQKPPHTAARKWCHLKSGFTLMETVIAIGVLAVLLTGFIAVFTPAAQGIRRSISSQDADRLTTALERELVTPRSGQAPATDQSNPVTAITGFTKGFTWIKEGNLATNATIILVYQYRGNPASSRPDGTPTPLPTITGQPGTDYIVQSMARRLNDTELVNDLKAIEGSIFFIKPTQLVSNGTEMILGTAGEIKNADGSVAATAATYTDAVIAFSAEFHSVPTKAFAYLNSATFKTSPTGLFYTSKNPVFTRNLAIRR